MNFRWNFPLYDSRCVRFRKRTPRPLQRARANVVRSVAPKGVFHTGGKSFKAIHTDVNSPFEPKRKKIGLRHAMSSRVECAARCVYPSAFACARFHINTYKCGYMIADFMECDLRDWIFGAAERRRVIAHLKYYSLLMNFIKFCLHSRFQRSAAFALSGSSVFAISSKAIERALDSSSSALSALPFRYLKVQAN